MKEIKEKKQQYESPYKYAYRNSQKYKEQNNKITEILQFKDIRRFLTGWVRLIEYEYDDRSELNLTSDNLKDKIIKQFKMGYQYKSLNYKFNSMVEGQVEKGVIS